MTTAPVRSLAARRLPLADASEQRRTLERLPLARDFDAALAQAGIWPLRRGALRVVQINVGKLCNQTCKHCHVDAGPDRREQMSRETMEACLALVERSGAEVVDITGGAPELHPDFRWLVERARALGKHVVDRCNLTVLDTPSHRDLPAFFASERVELVCSLPHHARLSTDRQRGDGVFEKSIRMLQRLNEVGYGGGELRLVLVTNPVGAFLPPEQATAEREWKAQLLAQHGVRFDALYCLTNMPISRYLEWLIDSGNLERYLSELVRAFNPAAVAGLMCRDTLSVGWDGTLYDCDFNQMLELPSAAQLSSVDASALPQTKIVVGRHCFGCTAGAGSSCGGSTAR